MSMVAQRATAILLMLSLSAALEEARAQDVWQLLKQPGHAVLMRHANAPGVGEDPPGIDLKNCKLQRNLDDTGKNQARVAGDTLRQHGITSA